VADALSCMSSSEQALQSLLPHLNGWRLLWLLILQILGPKNWLPSCPYKQMSFLISLWLTVSSGSRIGSGWAMTPVCKNNSLRRCTTVLWVDTLECQ
jgi:hypothetical protein